MRSGIGVVGMGWKRFGCVTYHWFLSIFDWTNFHQSLFFFSLVNFELRQTQVDSDFIFCYFNYVFARFFYFFQNFQVAAAASRFSFSFFVVFFTFSHLIFWICFQNSTCDSRKWAQKPTCDKGKKIHNLPGLVVTLYICVSPEFGRDHVARGSSPPRARMCSGCRNTLCLV